MARSLYHGLRPISIRRGKDWLRPDYDKMGLFCVVRGEIELATDHTTDTNQDTRQDFTQGSIPKHLIAFSTPLFLGNALQALYNTVDSVWVGQYLGSQGLAAVSVSGPVIFSLVALVTGIGMAATALIAQYSGAKDRLMVQKTVANSFVLMAVLGGISSAAGFVFRGPLLRLINTPEDIMDMASSYLGIILGGLLTMFIYNTISAVMRGLGDSRTPLIFLAYATVLNMILDPILIFGIGPFPKMGVAGAALATVIAQGFSGVLGLRHMAKIGLLKFEKSALRLDLGLTARMFSIGLPAGIQQIVVSMGMLAMTSLVNKFGSGVVAAFGAGGRLDQFAFMPAMSVGLAVTALVGQNLGAGRQDRVKEIVRFSVYLTVGITAVVSLIAVSFPTVLLRLFTKKHEVLAEGVKYLRVVGFAYIPYSLMFMLSGVMRGAGDTFPSMVFSIATLWLVRIPLARRLSESMGSRGLWFGMAASAVAGALLNWLYFVSGRWRSRSLIREKDVSEKETAH